LLTVWISSKFVAVARKDPRFFSRSLFFRWFNKRVEKNKKDWDDKDIRVGANEVTGGESEDYVCSSGYACELNEWRPKQNEENLRREWKMAWVRVSGPPRVEVAVDMGNPFLNLTVDAFLRIGTVIFSPFSLSFLNYLINYFYYLFILYSRSQPRAQVPKIPIILSKRVSKHFINSSLIIIPFLPESE